MKKYIILLLLLVSFILPLKAQYINNEGAKITIGSTSFVRGGEWSNTNATSQTNLFGNLSLTENLINNGIFSGANASTLFFVGTVMQNVQGTNPLSLYNMQINNGANNVTLQNSITISNLLSLTNGRLISETAPIFFSPTALNPVETDANHIIGTATMQNRAIGMAALPTFLGISLNAGDDIGSLSITRYTGSQGIITIPTGQSIASTWSFNATNTINRDITYDWLSGLDNGLDLSTLQLRSSPTLAGTWTTTGGNINAPTRTYTSNHALNENWSFFNFVAPPIPPLPIPATPTNFTATTISTTQINLSWQPVAQNVTGYRVYQNNVLIATLPAGASSYELTGLDLDSRYSFNLVAINQRNGEIKFSNPINATNWTFPEKPTLLSSVSKVCGSGKGTVSVRGTGSIFRVYNQETNGTLLLESINGSFELPSVSETTTFYVSVIGRGGRESKTIAVTVEVQPTFEAKIIGEASRVTCDKSVVLEAEPIEGATYRWFRNNVEVGTGQTYEATFSADYQVRISKDLCSFLSEKVSVTLNATPVAKIQQVNGTRFCDRGTLNAIQISSGTTYEWLLNNEVIGQGTTLSVSQSGTYILQVTQNGCKSDTQVEVVVSSTPSAPVLEVTESVICLEGETTISIQNPQTNLVYEWTRGREVLNVTGNSFTTSVIGVYKVRAISSQNSSCSVLSNEVTFSTLRPNPIYLRVSQDKKTLFLEDVNLSQADISSVEWYFEGEVASDLGTETQIEPKEDGYYSARVINSNGCIVQTRTVYFSIPEIPIITGEEEAKEDSFKLYPNPSKGIFKVHFSTILLEDIQISIFDATGKVIRKQIFEKGSQEFSIDLQKIARGMYMIRFNQNDSVYSKQIIIE